MSKRAEYLLAQCSLLHSHSFDMQYDYFQKIKKMKNVNKQCLLIPPHSKGQRKKLLFLFFSSDVQNQQTLVSVESV